MNVIVSKFAQEVNLLSGETTSAITLLLPTGKTVLCFVDADGFALLEAALRTPPPSRAPTVEELPPLDALIASPPAPPNGVEEMKPLPDDYDGVPEG